MNYAEAKRKARTLLGQHADVKDEGLAAVHSAFFRYRVGVWAELEKSGKQFVICGCGASWEAALESVEDATKHQKKET